MIELKSRQEIETMAQAGAVVAALLEYLADLTRPGITTKALDEEARAFLRAKKAKPAFLGYRGFPACICVSVNEEVVHGIPGEREIRHGDLVSLDAGAVVDGFYADAARTVAVGVVSPEAQRLLETAERALAEGIQQAVVGRRVNDIAHAVQRLVEAEGFSVVREFVGHGIGRAMHEEPPVPNFGPPNIGPRLKAGMVLAIEPMVTAGRPDVEILADGWTAVTKDHSLAAHAEDTVAVTDHGARILTRVLDAQRRGD